MDDTFPTTEKEDAFLIVPIFSVVYVNANYFISVCDETLEWHLVA